jgi:Bacterial Ig-like domain (group 3)
LLNYSSDFTQWSMTANAVAIPTLSPDSSMGADGSPNTASVLVMPDTSATGNQGADYSGISQTGSGTYAGTAMTFSVWLSSPTSATVIIALADGGGTAQNTATCSVTTAWQRCAVTANFAVGAAPGFIASILNWGGPAETVGVYHGQVEQALTPGVFVRTTGTSATGTGGTATFGTVALLTATHNITTVYSGDANYLGSTSSVLPVIVTAGSSTITLSSSNLDSTYGQSVTFTSTVTGTTTIPTGVITFLDGATTLGTGTLDATGKAIFTTSTLLVGSHTITASYGGDTEYLALVSSAMTQVVEKAAVVITATSSANPSSYGDGVTFNLTATGSGVIPTGTLTLTDGATTLSVLTLDATGAASYTTSTLTAGTHALTVTYSGDQNYK